MSSLAGWLYGDGHATTYLRYEESFAELRAGLKTRYFDRLARELFLENAHRAKVDVVPDPGMPDDETARLAAIESQVTKRVASNEIESIFNWMISFVAKYRHQVQTLSTGRDIETSW